MANKSVGQLPEATSVGLADLLLLEQTGIAKKLTGQTLRDDLLVMLDGHGGIASWNYTEPVAPSVVGTLTLTLADGSVISIPITNGTNGTNGTDGTDGVSSSIAVSNIPGGHRLTITDVNGTRTVDIPDGTDGYSPQVTVSETTGGHTMVITDQQEQQTVFIPDGVDGVTFTPSVSGGVLSWTNDGGRVNPPSVIINGRDGTNGEDGATYIPSVSQAGVISWDNDRGYPNPPPVDIKGAKGDTGDNWYVYIRWASQQPTSDADVGVSPDAWMGVYGGASATAPTHYTDYQWYEVKGEKGADGDPITAVVRTGGDGSPGTDDTYTVYVNTTAVGTFIVHNGVDGIGTVNSINGIGVEAGTNNVVLSAADVGAPTIPLHVQATLTTLPRTISNASITASMRVIEFALGTPTAISSDITWTTADGSIVLSGAMSGSTTVDITLVETN